MLLHDGFASCQIPRIFPLVPLNHDHKCCNSSFFCSALGACTDSISLLFFAYLPQHHTIASEDSPRIRGLINGWCPQVRENEFADSILLPVVSDVRSRLLLNHLAGPSLQRTSFTSFKRNVYHTDEGVHNVKTTQRLRTLDLMCDLYSSMSSGSICLGSFLWFTKMALMSAKTPQLFVFPCSADRKNPD